MSPCAPSIIIRGFPLLINPFQGGVYLREKLGKTLQGIPWPSGVGLLIRCWHYWENTRFFFIFFQIGIQSMFSSIGSNWIQMILTMIPSVSLPVAPCWLSSGCAAAVRNALSRSSKWINMEPLDLQPANELDPAYSWMIFVVFRGAQDLDSKHVIYLGVNVGNRTL